MMMAAAFCWFNRESKVEPNHSLTAVRLGSDLISPPRPVRASPTDVEACRRARPPASPIRGLIDGTFLPNRALLTRG
jgi:hypothetical protein